MAYVYICDQCKEGEHEKCEEWVGKRGTTGVGHCICSHGPEKSKFEQNVWDRDK